MSQVKSIIDALEEILPYSVGDRVYHAIASDQFKQGIILDWEVGSMKLVKYLVCFGPGTNFWLIEEELTTDKPVEF